MDPLNPIFAIIVYLIAFATAYVINYRHKIINDNSRFESLDGIRGFLAIGVFIHHAAIWHNYLQIKLWQPAKTNLYNQLGQTSVSIFFMITAFLFVTKLLNTNQKINWNQFFISRFFRIVPMYLVSVVSIVLIVFSLCNWKLNVTPDSFSREMLSWLTFNIFSLPIINGSTLTYIINAYVTWSLAYEWFFYFSLPIIAIFITKKINSITYIIISLIFCVVFYKFHELKLHHLLSFLGGMITPFIIKYNTKKINFNSIFFSAVILVCLGLILCYRSSNGFICKFLIIIVFNIIALGNNLFGILKNSTLKFLGEISYSTYLIHAIILFIVMYFCLTLEKAQNLSPLNFCILIYVLTPILVFISYITYSYIEKPFINFSKRINFKK